jgi:hypothetical protein
MEKVRPGNLRYFRLASEFEFASLDKGVQMLYTGRHACSRFRSALPVCLTFDLFLPFSLSERIQ